MNHGEGNGSEGAAPPGSGEGGGGDRWSFRRFGADAQAQASSDTWDELHRRGLAVMTEIAEHDGSLYEARHETEASMQALGIPRTTDCAAAARQSTAAARTLLRTLQDVAPPTDAGATAAAAGRDCVHVVPLNADQLGAIRDQLEAWITEAGRLAARTIATIETASATRKRLGEIDTRVRDMILTVWALNAEKAKAFPPFFANIGPIESTLYGIGRTTTSSTATDPPPSPAGS